MSIAVLGSAIQSAARIYARAIDRKMCSNIAQKCCVCKERSISNEFNVLQPVSRFPSFFPFFLFLSSCILSLSLPLSFPLSIGDFISSSAAFGRNINRIDRTKRCFSLFPFAAIFPRLMKNLQLSIINNCTSCRCNLSFEDMS